MKKQYKKPILCVERFVLTQTIAHNCGHNLDFSMGTLKTKESCGWNVGGFELFIDPKICDYAMDGFFGACYNAPEGGYNIFQS